jgi:hypothetical protein
LTTPTAGSKGAARASILLHILSRRGSQFYVGPETEYYRVYLQGFTDAGIGDSLAPHDRMFFSTFDADHDTWGSNCAQQFHGGRVLKRG